MATSNTFCDSTTRKVPRIKIVGDEDLPRIHEASIDLLENTGLIFEHEEALGVFKKTRGKGGRQNRLYPQETWPKRP